MPGGRIDPERTFTPLDIGVLTVSDTRDLESETSGALLVECVTVAGHRVVAHDVVKDDKNAIQQMVFRWIDHLSIDVIVTTGGTGLTGRDVTPEALRDIFEKELEGFSTLWHLISYESVGVSTLQSRACAGIVGNTVIYALPGSNGACRDAWERIIKLQIDSRHHPCSIVDVMPRFQEV
jgi:molybdopterin adenylyltransferase